MTFASFFTRAVEQAPYAYQEALASKLFASRPVLDALVAPTGLGKTAAVTLAWAWDRVLERRGPRRMVWCLPMRTLVEQTAREVQRWFERLAFRRKPQTTYDCAQPCTREFY